MEDSCNLSKTDYKIDKIDQTETKENELQMNSDLNMYKFNQNKPNKHKSLMYKCTFNTLNRKGRYGPTKIDGYYKGQSMNLIQY